MSPRECQEEVVFCLRKEIAIFIVQTEWTQSLAGLGTLCLYTIGISVTPLPFFPFKKVKLQPLFKPSFFSTLHIPKYFELNMFIPFSTAVERLCYMGFFEPSIFIFKMKVIHKVIKLRIFVQNETFQKVLLRPIRCACNLTFSFQKQLVLPKKVAVSPCRFIQHTRICFIYKLAV